MRVQLFWQNPDASCGAEVYRTDHRRSGPQTAYQVGALQAPVAILTTTQ